MASINSGCPNESHLKSDVESAQMSIYTSTSAPSAFVSISKASPTKLQVALSAPSTLVKFSAPSGSQKLKVSSAPADKRQAQTRSATPTSPPLASIKDCHQDSQVQAWSKWWADCYASERCVVIEESCCASLNYAKVLGVIVDILNANEHFRVNMYWNSVLNSFHRIQKASNSRYKHNAKLSRVER